MQDSEQRTSRRILFPLRSAVELFVDPKSPGAVTKAKEAALLYDELIFEVGMLDVSITPQGGSNVWIPPDQLSPELVARSREVVPAGTPMTLSVGKQTALGVPAEEMHVMVQGEISNAYVSQFHSGILDELEKFEPDWIRTIDIGGEKHPGRVGEPIYEAIRQRNFSDFADKSLMPEVEHFLRSFVYEGFNRDAVIATSLGASLTNTPLFRPMVERGDFDFDYPGSEALSILVADLTNLPWEAVIEFREHPGSEDARQRLREFERIAAESGAEDAYAFLKKVSQEVNRALRSTIDDLAPSLPEELAKQILLTGVALISVIGAPIAAGADVASAISASREFSNSWIAAIMVLAS